MALAVSQVMLLRASAIQEVKVPQQAHMVITCRRCLNRLLFVGPVRPQGSLWPHTQF